MATVKDHLNTVKANKHTYYNLEIMSTFNKNQIGEIEENLKLHINYKGVSSGGKYLQRMDRLTYNYSGVRGIALSNMLSNYYKQVNVKNLDEALERLRKEK
tara:strand:- start:1153 stop:1455 length:303 start_codon:yes stop_codon:yes gene_type:complete